MPTLAEPVMAAHSSLKSLKKVSHSEHNIIIITNHQGGRPGGGGGDISKCIEIHTCIHLRKCLRE